MNKIVVSSMEEAFSGCVPVLNWKDSKLISLASNKLKAEPMQKAKKWDRIHKKNYIDVLNSINIYNKHMGDIDRFDQQVSVYKIKIRSKYGGGLCFYGV